VLKILFAQANSSEIEPSNCTPPGANTRDVGAILDPKSPVADVESEVLITLSAPGRKRYLPDVFGPKQARYENEVR
jgi:hypothetical protein